MPDEVLPQFVRVPPGDFGMGADDGDEDERPAHRVHLDAFYMSVHCDHQRAVCGVRACDRASRAGGPRSAACSSRRHTNRPFASWRRATPGAAGIRRAIARRHPGDAGRLPRRGRLLRLAVPAHRPAVRAADRSRVGARGAWRPRAAPLSVGRRHRSVARELPSRSRARRSIAARGRSAATRPTGSSSTT